MSRRSQLCPLLILPLMINKLNKKALCFGMPVILLSPTNPMHRGCWEA